MNRQIQTIDATGQKAGRLASQIAFILQGKDKTEYQSNADLGDFVKVINLKGMEFSGKKVEQKIYYRYTGHPGGIRTESLKNKLASKPEKVLRDMIYNMLPKNKLRPEMIKRLSFDTPKKSKA